MSKKSKKKAKQNSDEFLDELFRDYEHYTEYRNAISDGELKVSEGTDKAILTISGIGLSLLLFLTKSLSEQSETFSSESFVLVVSILSGSLICVICSLVLSGIIYKLNRRKCDEILHNRIELISKIQNNKCHACSSKVDFSDQTWLRWLNNIFHFSGPILLILGLILILSFVSTNIMEQKNANSAKATTSETCVSRADTSSTASPPST